MVLGVTVAALRPRAPTALAFAAFAMGVGLSGVQVAAIAPFATTVWFWWIAGAFGTVGLWGLFALFPRRLERGERSRATLTAVVGLAGSFLLFLGQGSGVPGNDGTLAGTISATLAIVVSGGIYAVALMLPLRARGLGPSEAAAARSFAIVAVAWLFLSAGTFAELRTIARGDAGLTLAVADLAYILVPALLWLRATRGAHPAAARAVIVANVIIYPASLLAGPDAAWAIGRVLSALLLAYAVLRGQIEGLDLKVRFAISKSTVAAIFVAVFFLASEGAQIFFGQQNQLVGLIAAGALVFAMAPLQRAADRLAERAVPTATPSSSSASTSASSLGKEQAYRSALRAALRDRVLTREEEIGLAHLSDELGLSHQRAREIWHGVEAEGEAAAATRERAR